eukprot:6064951-Prymnesium_polylepis.1
MFRVFIRDEPPSCVIACTCDLISLGSGSWSVVSWSPVPLKSRAISLNVRTLRFPINGSTVISAAPRTTSTSQVDSQVGAQDAMKVRRSARLRIKPVVDRHVQPTRRGKALDLVVPVRGEQECAALGHVDRQRLRVPEERVALEIGV